MLQGFQSSPSNVHLALDFHVCNTVKNLWYPVFDNPERSFNRVLDNSPLHFTVWAAREICN
jgi:hypothetical protein